MITIISLYSLVIGTLIGLWYGRLFINQQKKIFLAGSNPLSASVTGLMRYVLLVAIIYTSFRFLSLDKWFLMIGLFIGFWSMIIYKVRSSYEH